MGTAEKLAQLRKAMQRAGVDGFIQPVHDEYLSEYPPAAAQRVRWLSRFSGSAGTAVVLKGKAALFTDGRYTLQATNETDVTLFEQHNIATMQAKDWVTTSGKGARIGYDARLFTQPMLSQYEKAAKDAGIVFVTVENLVDAIWKDKPAAPASPLFIHSLEYSGKSAEEKRQKIAALLVEKKASHFLLTAPDSICWLFNIRAADVEHTPLVLANALVSPDGAMLFVDSARCSAEVRAHLGNTVQLAHPNELPAALKKLSKKRVLTDKSTTPLWHLNAMKDAEIIDTPDPCQRMKAIKNATELAGIRAAHIRDGAAIVKLLHWLDGAKNVTELNVCDKLHAFRAQHDMFHDESFPTIAGSGPNGAIVHYRATQQSNRALQTGELLLLDSGAQYPDGTTDITRTIAIGKSSAEMCDRFTRVLKGHIAIARARFPEGTVGSQLDTLARQYLWEAGVDYDHGTGHGVGCFLGVHEGPQRISKRGGDAALAVGMLLSNEPGYYKTGAYGIRIENLVTVVESGKGFFGFDTVTCVPIDTRLINSAMLTAEEKNWLNSYHAWVNDSLSKHLDEAARQWLAKACAAI